MLRSFLVFAFLLAILCLGATGRGEIQNSDFETGNLTGWTATGKAFTASPVSDGLKPGWKAWQGKFYANSWSTAETYATTGTLRSAPFRLSKGAVTFLVSGWGSSACYVTLNRASDNQELARVPAPLNDDLAFYEARLEAPAHLGEDVYLEIVDLGVTQNDWICVDDFKEVPPESESGPMKMTIDLTGNWRDTDQFQPRIQTREPALADGAVRAFHQALNLPAGAYALTFEYVPQMDKKPAEILGGKLDGFTGLAINGQPQPLNFIQSNTKKPAHARCEFTVPPNAGSTRITLALHGTRVMRTRLSCAEPLPAEIPAGVKDGGSLYQAIAPVAGGQLLVAHGVPFMVRQMEWFHASLQQGVDRGGLQPWKDGMIFDGANAPVKTAYFLGMIHNIDLGNGSWYSPKGDHGYSHFAGDKAGAIAVTFADDTQTTVPLVIGYNIWFSRPWDMIWNYNWGTSGPGGNRDTELFGGSEQERDIIRNGLALVDGVRLMGSESSNTRFIFALDLQGRKVKSIQIRNTPELHDYPLISAVTLETTEAQPAPASKNPSLTPLPRLCPDPVNIPPVSLDAIAHESYRPGVDRIMRALYTFVDDLPRLEHPEIPEGYFGPDYDFQGQPDAVYAACYLYRNGPECASHCPDSGHGCSSPTASGQLCQYMDGMGVWFRNGTFYKNVTDWFARYQAATPGQFPGSNYGWTRGEGPLLRETIAFGYDKYVGTYTDWIDHALFAESNPPHWGRAMGNNHASYEVKVGDVTERGNRENDGHGLLMMARYMVWHWLGQSREWNEKHWKATEASADWLQWQLDTDTLRPGKRKDVLYTESECAHDSYDIYSTYNCVYGLKLAMHLARQLGKTEQIERWQKLYDRLRQGCLDHLVDKTDCGPVWHTDPINDWQDNAHKLIHITLASDGETYTPLQDYDTGTSDSLDRRFLEISQNTYRFLMKEKNYNCLRMYGYGQGYMTQAALLLDQMEDATQFLDMLLRHCYLPKLGGWASPEGIILHRSGMYYLPVNGYMGQDVHVAESSKAVRLMLGVDDNDPAHLRFVPRYPAAWTHLTIDRFPMLTGDRRQLGRYTYDRRENGQTFTWGLEQPVERISVRLGPLPAGKTIRQASINGKAAPFEKLHSGDSDWVWVKNLQGREGTVEVSY